MTIKEVYEKYLYMDDIMSSAISRDFRSTIIRDLWQAIKEEVEKVERMDIWHSTSTDDQSIALALLQQFKELRKVCPNYTYGEHRECYYDGKELGPGCKPFYKRCDSKTGFIQPTIDDVEVRVK